MSDGSSSGGDARERGARTRGEEGALEALMPLVYEQLRGLAHRVMSAERPDHTLEPTALVHEAYLRLAETENPPWQSRDHFLALTARLMRRLLVDHARSHAAAKRGGLALKVPLDGEAGAPVPASPEEPAEDLLDLDAALHRLAGLDERKARTLEMRFFGGLTIEETARSLGVSTATVILDCRLGKAWLVKEIRGGRQPAP